MKLYLTPQYTRPDTDGAGGIRRVVEAQMKYLPEHGIEIVQSPKEADVVNVHATEVVDHPCLVLSCHGLYWTEDRWGDIKWVKNANKLLIEGFRKAQHITVPSEWVGNVLRRGMLLQPTVIGHGIDIAEWEPAPSEGYVLYNKNREDPSCRSDAVNYLAQRFSETQFVTTYGRSASNVHVVGRVSYDTMRGFVRGAGVYLSVARETFGTGMLEALACGVPVLSWDYGGASEIITHKVHGYLAEPGNYNDLIEGLNYCLKHRQALGEAGRQLVIDRYQWKDVIPNYARVYQEALNATRHEVKVSIVCTSYNLGRYLPDAVRSVKEQQFHDWELIIVNDASTDNTAQIADALAAEDDRIRVIHNQHNTHVSEARNIGFRNARGQYMMALDADDMLGPDALRVLTRALDQDPSIQIACGSMEVFDGRGDPFVSEWPPANITYQGQIAKQNQLPYSALCRREVWERLGGYRRRIRTGVEDADFWTRALSFGFRGKKVTNKVTLRYRMRSDSLSHTRKGENWLRWYPWAKQAELTPWGAPDIEEPIISCLNPTVISVVVPVGPGHDVYLQDCLDSLLAQTYRYWEVLVVNDTGHPIDLQGYPFARLITTTGRTGPAHARNEGVRAAKGKYVVFLDADDYAQPNMLAALLKAQQEVGGWVYPDWFADNGKEVYPDHAQDWHAEGLTRKMLGPITGIYRRVDLEAVGGFDESIPSWEDWDLHLSLLERGICGTRLAEPLFTYRYRTGTQRDRALLDLKQDLLKYIRKKHTNLYEGDSIMGCSKCGGGGGHTTIVGSKAFKAQADKTDDLVLMEYIGKEPQTRHFRSRVKPNERYRFGANQREFFVHRGDVNWMVLMNQFRVKEQPKVEVGGFEPVQVEYTPPLPQDVLIEDLDLETDLVNYLKDAGYTTVEQVRLASDTALLTIKGIGPKRIEAIRKAVENV